MVAGCVCFPSKTCPQSNLLDQTLLSRQKGFQLRLQPGRSAPCRAHCIPAASTVAELTHCQHAQRGCWKQHRKQEVGRMKCAYSRSGSCLQSRVSLVLGVLDKRRSRTESLDAVCACGLPIQITYLLCYTCLGYFYLFYFISRQESGFLPRHSINTATC